MSIKFKMKPNNFDERQLYERGKGFQYGFIAALVMILLNSFAEDSNFIINTYSRFILCIWIPTTVCLVYFIIKDAYEGIKENSGNIAMGIFLVTGLILLAVVTVRLITGSAELLTDGIFGDWIGQIAYSVCMILISAVYFIKQHLDNKKDTEDEE